jgi:transposase-like protein
MRFPDEEACLFKVFEGKFGNGQLCQYCGDMGVWRKIGGTKKYRHSCGRQISPCKDTAFYRSNVSLMAHFYAILLFSNCSSGVRSTFLRKQLGLGPKSAHELCNRVRLHMAAYERAERVGGVGKIVEVDEVLLRHVRHIGTQRHQAVIVMGIFCEGQILSGIISDRTRGSLHARIQQYVRPGSTVVTDDWQAYKGLERFGYNHVAVNHSLGFFNEGGFSTCQIDSYWASLRRAMRSYHQVAPHNLWLFLAEIECRYNSRQDRPSLFNRLVSNWPKIAPDTIKALEHRFDWRHKHITA